MVIKLDEKSGWIVTMDETFRHTNENMVIKQKKNSHETWLPKYVNLKFCEVQKILEVLGDDDWCHLHLHAKLQQSMVIETSQTFGPIGNVWTSSPCTKRVHMAPFGLFVKPSCTS